MCHAVDRTDKREGIHVHRRDFKAGHVIIRSREERLPEMVSDDHRTAAYLVEVLSVEIEKVPAFRV